MKQIKIVRALLLAAIVAAVGAPAAFANCSLFGGFPIFQCGNLAYFDTIPNFDPNVYQFTDPNDGSLRTQNISAVFWQIGFGNQTLNDGLGSSGAGYGYYGFSGIDQGINPPSIQDGRVATANPLIPAGSICLSNNNWGNSGIDGCPDNYRADSAALQFSSDGILNPYYNVARARNSQINGFYSLDWQQDYPMAALVKNVDGKFFAFAVVATLDRGNSKNGQNGPCATTPGTNPAPCDNRPGFYDFKDVKNGAANPTDPNLFNVIPWQPTPDPNITANVPVDPNDPNSDRVINLAWSAVTVHSDQTVRKTTNPAMGGGICVSAACNPKTRDLTRAPGVGVGDIAGKFGGLVRYVLQVASPSDPNFLAPMSQMETTTTSISSLQIPFGSCIRLETLFGKKPETTSQTFDNCRLGKCGDIGYEVVSVAKCVTSSVCQNTGPEVCDNVDNDCNGQIDDGNPGGGASCSTGQPGVCSAGTTTCQSGSLGCIENTPASAEVCDGLDNDCDGQTDEGNPGGGAGCSTGLLGPCAAGTEKCQGGSIQCVQSDLNFPRVETCNNLDDNCDGAIDGFQTDCGAGICLANGTCVAGVDNCSPGSPVAETCNNQDDNCDGLIDNILALACSTGLPGPCNVGATVCQSGSAQCVKSNPSFPRVESCNSIDDDCNGTVDDGAATTPTCGLGACLRAGTCSSGTVICTPGVPSTETCNNVDDNCDGTIDAFITTCGVGACQSNGFCSSGNNLCNPGAPVTEICNNIDDNCDGTVDGFATACGVGTCARAGSCTAGANSCQAGTPGVEVCDSLDNDCNGTVDNISPACTLYVTAPIGSDILDCTSPSTFQPTITWNKAQYDKFKVSIGTSAAFTSGTFATSGDKALTTNSWHVKEKAWTKVCGKATDGGPIFIKIQGTDVNVPTSNPLRKFTSPVAQATANK